MTPAIHLFDSLLEPCLLLDERLKIIYCNETFATLAGVSTRKASKYILTDLLTFEANPDWFQNLHAVTSATPYKELRFRTLEGNEGRIQLTAQPFSTGEQPSWILFVRDVTLEDTLQKKYRGELEQKEGYILELKAAQAELEKYSKDLEKMVDQRTAEIRSLNQLMGALLDSLSQGFFLFDRQGKCHDFSSRACLDVLEGAPNNRPVWDVLKLAENKVEGFQKWLVTLFDEMLPFEDLAPLGPTSYPHQDGKSIQLEYFPLRDQGQIQAVVVVASDISSLVEAQKQAESERQNAMMILNLVHKKQQVSRFLREARLDLTNLKSLLETPSSAWDQEQLFRVLHTLKGGAASFNLQKMKEEAHEAENLLAKWKEVPDPFIAESLRTAQVRLDETFAQFLTETKEILGHVATADERILEIPWGEFQTICRQLSHWTKGQELANRLRHHYLMEPIENFFSPYGEVMEKLAQSLNKALHPLRLINGGLPVLPEAYQSLFATFVHVFRNAIDHGIESPSERVAQGKTEAGLVTIAFERDQGTLRIMVQDDGRGIDPLKIRQHLERKGQTHHHESDEAVIQHIFDASFSTQERVTEVSGRGVGLDALKAVAKELGGSVRVSSTPGKGSILICEVPWFDEIGTLRVPGLRLAS